MESLPGGSEMSSMFGLGMKAPTHMLLNLRKGPSKKVDAISEDDATTSSRHIPPPQPKPPRVAKQEISETDKPKIPTCLSKEAEALFLEQHERRLRAQKAAAAASDSGSANKSDTKNNSEKPTTSSSYKTDSSMYSGPNSKQADPSTEAMTKQAPPISESEKKPTAVTKTETAQHAKQASSSPAKTDSVSPKASPASPEGQGKKEFGISSNKLNSSTANSVEDEGFESDVSRSLDLSDQGSNTCEPASPATKHPTKQGSSTQSTNGYSKTEMPKLRDEAKLTESAAPANIINVQQAQSTLSRAKDGSASGSNPNPDDGKRTDDKPPKVETTLRPLDSMRTPKTILKNLPETSLQSNQTRGQKRGDLTGPSTAAKDQLKVPAENTKVTFEKLKPKPESAPKKVTLQPQTAVLKLPQISSEPKPKPGAPLAKNYLKGAPPTSLKFEKEPGLTKDVMEKRTKVMAKQFASLSLALSGNPGGSDHDQSKAAKSKNAAKKKEKKVKIVAPAPDPTEEAKLTENDEDGPRGGTPTNTSIGSRPSSAISDVDV